MDELKVGLPLPLGVVVVIVQTTFFKFKTARLATRKCFVTAHRCSCFILMTLSVVCYLI